MPENKIPFMHNNKCLMFALQKWLDFVNISSSDLCCCCFSGLFFWVKYILKLLVIAFFDES